MSQISFLKCRGESSFINSSRRYFQSFLLRFWMKNKILRIPNAPILFNLKCLDLVRILRISRGLRQPLYLFFFLCISPSHTFLPLSLQPETLLPKHHFFRNAKLVYTKTQESTEHQLYIQLIKTFTIRWDRTWVLSVQK